MSHLEGFVQYLKDEKRYSAHTQKAYLSDLTQFSHYLESAYEISEPENATSQMVRSWVIDMMENDTTARSVNRKLSTLKSFYKYLLRENHIKENPMVRVSSPKTESRLPVYMEQDDMEMLFSDDMFDEGFTGMRNKLLLMLLYYTGMRRSELIGLTLSSYDAHNRSLKVLGKGNKERILPINKELSDLLTLYIEKRSETENNCKE